MCARKLRLSLLLLLLVSPSWCSRMGLTCCPKHLLQLCPSTGPTACALLFGSRPDSLGCNYFVTPAKTRVGNQLCKNHRLYDKAAPCTLTFLLCKKSPSHTLHIDFSTGIQGMPFQWVTLNEYTVRIPFPAVHVRVCASVCVSN